MSTRTGEVRIAHCRFMKDDKKWIPLYRKDRFDRVVSSVWSFDNETRILTYGATVYKKESKDDFWVKKQHREKALERYNKCPVRVKLTIANFLLNEQKYGIKRAAIDWYMALELVYTLGVNNKINDPSLVLTKIIDVNFNRDYDIFYDYVVAKRRERDEMKTRFLNEFKPSKEEFKSNSVVLSMAVVGVWLGLGWAYYLLISKIL